MIGLVSRATGGTAVPGLMSVVSPDRRESEGLCLRVPEAVDALGFANFLSAMGEQERGARRVLRVACGLTRSEAWAERFESAADSAGQRAGVLEELIGHLGGNPAYVSPSAHLVQYVSAKVLEPCLIEGSLDEATQEQALLEAAVHVLSRSRHLWRLLGEIGDKLPASDARDRVQAAAERARIDGADWIAQEYDRTVAEGILRG